MLFFLQNMEKQYKLDDLETLSQDDLFASIDGTLKKEALDSDVDGDSDVEDQPIYESKAAMRASKLETIAAKVTVSASNLDTPTSRGKNVPALLEQAEKEFDADDL